jgi:L-alanine-DL-glutamate epimerase-like enolase superfamily enzyme
MTTSLKDVNIERLDVAAYTIPTDFPEADGTITWDSTTIVVVELLAGGVRGLGYTYASPTAAALIVNQLAGVVRGRNAMDVPGAWAEMVRAVRNIGRPGIASMAISAVDSAVWDLKARLLDLPLCKLLGQVRDAVPVYGSGGFTTYSIPQLQDQLAGWVRHGIPRVKMKIGTHPEEDLLRVRAAREAIGPHAQLYVDANGAYTRKQALQQAESFAGLGVVWFEEPVTSDDLDGLRLLRDRAPAGMNIAAGEYGFDLWYIRRMLAAGAVDVQQADATRICGITGFLRAAAICESFTLPLSAHCAPALHLHPCTAVPGLYPVEYFHDHVRIEHMLFDGVVDPVDGALHPDLSRPGMGLTFKRSEAEKYAR